MCRGIARMYDCSLISVARGVGRGFMIGLERAVDEAGDFQSRPFLHCCPFL